MSRTEAIVIDADSHVTEPPDLFTSRITSQKFADLIPKVRYDEQAGLECWFLGDQRIGLFGASNMVIDPDGGDGPVPWTKAYPEFPRQHQIHPSSWDPTERLKVMDSHGITAAVHYGNLGVSRAYFKDVEDAGFRNEIVAAFNDWMADWTAVAPDRLIGLANLPFWDPVAAAEETARAAKQGHKGVVLSGMPERHGLLPFGDESWDPLWEACSEHDMPLHFHAGGGDISSWVNLDRQRVMGPGGMMAAGTTDIILETAITLSDLLHSGVLPRFPKTRWVVVESCVGYIPFVLESADYHFNRYQKRETNAFEAPPSEYFRRQCYGTYWFEHLTPALVEQVGEDNILFETDYPHPTCLLGDEVSDAIDTGLQGVSAQVREKIVWKNSAKLYRLDADALAAAAPVGA
jgi:predicted TIM-barrel fold metal-dependent hydrolase